MQTFFLIFFLIALIILIIASIIKNESRRPWFKCAWCPLFYTDAGDTAVKPPDDVIVNLNPGRCPHCRNVAELEIRSLNKCNRLRADALRNFDARNYFEAK